MAFGSSLTAAKRRMRIRSTSIGLLASLAMALIPVAPVVADHEHAPVPFSWDCWVGCGSNPALNCIRDRDLLEASRSETDHAAREVLDHIHTLLHAGFNEAADWVLADDAEFLHENDVFVFRFYSMPYADEQPRLEQMVRALLCPDERGCDIYISW